MNPSKDDMAPKNSLRNLQGKLSNLRLRDRPLLVLNLVELWLGALAKPTATSAREQAIVADRVSQIASDPLKQKFVAGVNMP